MVRVYEWDVCGICINPAPMYLIDPPHHALGYLAPENSYNPLFDPEIPMDNRQSKFGTWVSSYFIHSPSVQDLATPVRDLMKGPIEQRIPHPLKKATVTNFTSEDRLTIVEIVSQSHGDAFSFGEHARPVHEAVRIRAIFGNLNETSAPLVLPKVDISYIWCTESVWEAVLAMRLLQYDITSPPDHCYLARSVRFIPLEGGNHLVRNKLKKTPR